jgi:hemerythrin-like metal-binding protein
MDKELERCKSCKWRKMIVVWTNHLSLGNRAIDSAHERILGLINRVGDLTEAGDGAALKENLKLLENNLCACFEIEAKIAGAIQVDFSQHDLAHQRLLKDLQRIRNFLAEKNDVWSAREVEALTIPWAKRFTQHIKFEGESLKIVLNTHFYDFRPD